MGNLFIFIFLFYIYYIIIICYVVDWSFKLRSKGGCVSYYMYGYVGIHKLSSLFSSHRITPDIHGHKWKVCMYMYIGAKQMKPEAWKDKLLWLENENLIFWWWWWWGCDVLLLFGSDDYGNTGGVTDIT